MAAERLDGKSVAARIRDQLAGEIGRHAAQTGKTPGLAVVRVGEDPASKVYVQNKQKASAAVGIRTQELHLPESATQAEVIAVVERLNQDPDVHGILVQLPLPGGISPDAVLARLNPAKDVDGLTAVNLGRLTAGQPNLVPCTPAGIMRLLAAYQLPVSGRRAVVVGRSRLVGLPMALLLCHANATVTIIHRGTENPAAIAQSADILVVAAGSRGLVGRDWIGRGAVVVDVGMHRGPEGLTGDVRFAEAVDRAGWITPVPGGVGPLTVAMLLHNTWTAFLALAGPS